MGEKNKEPGMYLLFTDVCNYSPAEHVFKTIVRGRRIIYIYVIDSVTYVLAQYSITQQKSETTTLQLVALSSCQFSL